VNGTAQLFRIPFDGAAVPIASDFAIDPVWSPAGDFIVYSAADVGTQFPLKAVAPDGASYPASSITLTRGARRLRFSQGGRALLMMRGDIRHKDLWLVDLETGKDRQLTQLPPDFNIRDFDISPDGTEIMVERVQDHSDIVLIERPARAR
jgi:Tol biopolymer transport system component